MENADLSVAQKITIVGIATTAAVALGLGVIALGPAGVAKVPGSLVTSFRSG